MSHVTYDYREFLKSQLATLFRHMTWVWSETRTRTAQLQHNAKHCNKLQHDTYNNYGVIQVQWLWSWLHTTAIQLTFEMHTMTVELQHAATHCSTLQHTATRRIQWLWSEAHTLTKQLTFQAHTITMELQQTVTRCNTLQHTATHCHTLPHTATYYNTLPHTATRRIQWLWSETRTMTI